MANAMLKALEQKIGPIIKTLGYTLYDIEYDKKAEEIVFYIEKETGNITIDDCECVSRGIEDSVEQMDIIPGPYVLSVSSVGLDRPFTLDKDFKRALGQAVDIKLYQKRNGKKEFTGVLTDFNGETIFLQTEKECLELERTAIALARLHIDF